MHASKKIIIGGLIFLFVLTGLIFFCLNSYMSSQTEKDVRRIASVHLEGMMGEELNRFEVIKQIFFRQCYALVKAFNRIDHMDRDSIKKKIQEYSLSQNLAGCSLLSATGVIEPLFGSRIEQLDDAAFVINKLAHVERVVTAAKNSTGLNIVFAVPYFMPMHNGEHSIGILCIRPIRHFDQVMNLTSEKTFTFFHIIRKDSTYVIKDRDVSENTYFERLLNCSRPMHKTTTAVVAELNQAMQEGASYTCHIDYVDPYEHTTQRRTMHAVPLPESNWYLIAVIPYSALDAMISGMAHSRNISTLVAVSIMAVAIFSVLFIYIRITTRHINELELVTAEAEKAYIRANSETERALASQKEAELAYANAERSRQQAIAANKAKSDFLSNMSHDIRTPMNAILGMTAIAREHLDNMPRVADCLKKISLSGKQLLGLINDILDMSKIESGKMTLTIEAISLKETMETMCDIVRSQVNEKSIHFEINVSNIISENVYCDSIRLNQVLLNFLSNAIKFTPKGGTITIGLRQEESPKGNQFVRNYFLVRDTGIGMTDEFKKKLFQAFEREDSLRVHKTQGTGLGLSIVKHIVTAMDGEIRVESAKNQGTTFTVCVDFERVTTSKENMQFPEAFKILVVDDNANLREASTVFLQELGADVESCSTGEAGIEAVQKAHAAGSDYFAVLVDYKMDDMDGLTAIKAMHDIVGDGVHFVLISSQEWSAIEDEAHAAGVSGFIPKPLFKSTFYHELSKYYSQSVSGNTFPEEQQNALEGIRILLAEDNDLNAEIATVILSEQGAVVERAEDGQIALDLFSKSEPGYYNCVLMDLRMPNMNGYEATKAIRALNRPDAPALPIIAMTADAFAEDAKECLACGMNAHLTKPIDLDALNKTLRQHLHKNTQA
ncbi:MAG: response regulator [Desulfovibrionaceae bacterium]|nr:response regulator [Desulfovibrionaceae bacterium]